jgi:LysM repeat protein
MRLFLPSICGKNPQESEPSGNQAAYDSSRAVHRTSRFTLHVSFRASGIKFALLSRTTSERSLIMGRTIVVNLIRIGLVTVIFGGGMLFDRMLLSTTSNVVIDPVAEAPKPGDTTDPQADDGERKQNKKKDRLYIVKQGDTAVEVAERFRVSLKAVIDANPHIRDIAKIRIGTVLRIPRRNSKSQEAKPNQSGA